ncbi:MAG TPA: molybdenum cofactor guanylyltransferase [Candidatus Limnocylindrales bacterium]|nr:molybdenum cofactor guanylyltransferase [Candidatus Limnocylindrales bacterium]
MTSPQLSAIVLAGGRSSRFGRDKLAEPIDGRPLLDHAIEAVRPVATRILVVVAPDAAPPVPADVSIVHDPTPFDGPLAGLLAGLRAATDPVALAIGGDTPGIVVAVVDSMLAALDSAAVDAVVLEHDGRARPLPIVLRREPALAAATLLFAGGERRLRAIIEALPTHVIPEHAWRSLDPDAVTLRDIDTPADLP